MSHPPEWRDRDFDGGEYWWVWIDDGRVNETQAVRWCSRNGVAMTAYHVGIKHFNFDGRYPEQCVRWIGFDDEGDAILFYLAFG